MRRFLVALGLGVGLFGMGVRPAFACGGGVVTTTTEVSASVGDTQRVVMSMHDGVTDIIVQIGVPATTEDYGALLPEPYEPTLDPNPVPASDLEELDRQTTPRIFVQSMEGGGDDGGIGCLCAGAAPAGDKSGAPAPVEVSRPTDIGPVTAVVITATEADGVRAWLDENGFVIPADDLDLVDAYSGPGRYFIAIKRNQAAPTGAATSIGVHFTLPVDHAELPLRFARLGAASKVTFSVFLLSDRTLIPASPFWAITLDYLDGSLVTSQGYAAAVEAASARNGARSFVLEGSWMTTELDHRLGGLLQLLGARSATVTRLTTILPKDALQQDVHFTETFTGYAPRERTFTSNVDVSKTSAAAVLLALLLRRPKRCGRGPARLPD